MTTTAPPHNSLVAEADRYLGSRTATFAQRCDRYSAAHHVMQMHGGLTDDDILLDFGAGSTDLDAYIRTTASRWRGRYWPVDAWMGIDLQWWTPKRPVSWVVGLEIIEHLPMNIALLVIEEMKGWATKGVVLSTPNPDAVDVLAMDDTHLWSCYTNDLQTSGYTTEIASFYGQPNDSILAWWLR